jgi:BirA family biotin operon repressor/biotin-[acetyl-CoA-carboxylase] ligase
VKIERLGSVTSTNDVARERAREGAPEWSVVLADSQTAGRGRQGNVWISPPGNLCMSVLLRPALEAVGLLPLMGGVAVAEAASQWGVTAQLKWPNDAVVGERKLAGILAEAASSGGQVESVVLGIGVNLQLDPAEAPAELRATLTSVKRETGRSISPAEAADAVLGRLAVWYHALAREGPPPLLEAWRRRSVPWWGRRVEVFSAETRVAGTALDIDAAGRLVLAGDNGERFVVVSGEARELRLGTGV